MKKNLDGTPLIPENEETDPAKKKLMELIIRELKAARETPSACPRCHCTEFTKRGKDRNGRQRYLCHGCHRSFTSQTGSLLALSKLDMSTWLRFAGCMADVLPLELTARHCRVSVRTAWFMRIRVCEIVHQHLQDPRPGLFEIGLLQLPENHKGNHHLPASAMKVGLSIADSDRRKLRRTNIAFGTNQYGDVLFEVGKDARTPERASRDLIGRLPKGSIAVTGRASSLQEARMIHEQVLYLLEEHRFKMRDDTEERVTGFLACFKGVATAYLERYLDWFRYREQLKRGADVSLSFLFDSVYGIYQDRRSDLGDGNEPR